MADIEWNRYPNIDESQREALLRMTTSLGVHPTSILEDPHGHGKLMAWIRMEEQCGEAARRSLEEASEQLRREAQEYVQTEHARLEREALHRAALAEEAVQAQIAAAVAAALEAQQGQLLSMMRSTAPPPQPQAAQRLRKAVKLDVPKYSGKDGENLEHWLLAVTTAARAQLIEDEGLQVAFAISSLAGRAKQWSYSKLIMDSAAFPSWESFAQQLREVFLPPNSQLELRARLLSCKQGNRALHDFVHELRYLRAALTSDPLSESTLVTVFLEGLRHGRARDELFREIPATLEDGIRRALLAEFSMRGARGSYAPKDADHSTPMDLNVVGSKANVRCHHCNRLGHYRRECYALRDRERPTPMRSRSPGARRGPTARGPATAGNVNPQ